MQAVSGINQAIAIRNAPAQLEASAAVVKKNLETAETAGAAVVNMLKQAGDVGRNVDYKA